MYTAFKLYQVNAELEKLFEESIDEETGEVLDINAEKIANLELEKNQLAEDIALMVKNSKAEAEAIKQEATELGKRQKQAERRAESLKRLLKEVLGGEKLKTSKVSISYRKSESVLIDDEEQALRYLKTYRDDLLRYKEPEMRKDEIKKAIKDGEVFDGIRLAEKQSIIIK